MTTRSTELLRVVHTRPGITRAAAARALGVGTGAATELVARLSNASLITEAPATPSGSRGRPTTVLLPHPDGPAIAAAAITHEAWRIDVVELGGGTLTSVEGAHRGADGPVVIAAVTAALNGLRRTYGSRLRGLGVSVPGTVSRDFLLDASLLSWHDVDLRALWPDRLPPAGPAPAAWTAATPPEVFLAGNDASLAAAAEFRRGAATGARVALHLHVAAGLGGAVVEDGRVLLGARGAAGEFGHMPFGDPRITCPCGANGCWGTAVDGYALARILGDEPPPDPITYARRVITSGERRAVRIVAAALGRGIAGLVNGLDPDLVTLGGLAADLLAAAPDQLGVAYRAGLMGFRRADPPPVVPATLGDEGPIAGAAEQTWTELLTRLPT